MRKQRIEEILTKNITPIEQLQIVDESHQHAGRQGTESHFKIMIISEFFSSQSRVQRQRMVQQLLVEEFAQGLHALSLRLLTGEEAEKLGVFSSPHCAGGNKN